MNLLIKFNMIRYSKIGFIISILGFSVLLPLNADEQTLGSDLDERRLQTCQEFYDDQGECLESICFFGCPDGIMYLGCKKECLAKPCLQISAGKCPLHRCQLLVSCEAKEDEGEEKKICFDQLLIEPSECGGLAYAGQLECCPGMEKRCGVEFFDGSCDMEAKNSVYVVPICLPCGNGICNQFENRCNCPEDCE